MVEFLLVGSVLGLIQLAAALPWIVVLDAVAFKAWLRGLSPRVGLQVGLAVLAVVVAAPLLFRLAVTSQEQQVFWGRLYASALQIQLSADLFVLVFVILLRLWPAGGAVALAAFREGVRQPLFWVLTLVAVFLMFFSIFLPYFTFGDDYKMVKELGYDTIMLVATAFGVIAASTSISEEIEGKTAITVMSKPISRRQFLLGKFVGIALAAMAMTLLLGWFFLWVLHFKQSWFPNDLADKMPDPTWIGAFVKTLSPNLEVGSLLSGIGLWTNDLAQSGMGLVLGYGQLMVLLAIAVALATRLPMIVNLVVCLLIFFLGHLTPILAAVSKGHNTLVHFTAQVFDTVLPGLEFYGMGPAVIRDIPLPPAAFAWYVLSVTAYSLLYTTIALLFGLILFEDRDLA